MKRSLFFIFTFLALVLSACGSSTPNTTNTNDQGLGATSPADVDAAPTTDASGVGAAPTTDASGVDAAPTTDASGSAAAPTTDASGSAAAPTTDASGATTAPTTDVSGATAVPTTDASGTTGGSAQATTTPGEPAGDIGYVLENDPRFSMLAQAFNSSQLADTLRATGPYTVFAPTNDAFATLAAGELDTLMADPTQLGQLLNYHIVSGTMRSGDIATMTSLPTLNGQTIQVTKSGNDVMLNGNTRLVLTDIETTNGIIHVIDRVLTPSS